MQIESLRDLFVDQIQDLYSAENQIIAALPKLAEATESKSLKSAFEMHLQQTKAQAGRLEQIAQQLGIKLGGETCKGMQGVIAEGNELVKKLAAPEVKDAGLIAAAQRVEHYEIAGYGCARTYAQLLGEKQAVELLEQTLNEEKETDEKLTSLAEKINVKAEKAA